MASSLLPGRFGPPSTIQPPHSHSQPKSQPARSPPSPPMEETKISLPSISNLLGIADAGSPIHEHSPSSMVHSPQSDVFRQNSYFKTDSRPGSGYAHSLPHPSRCLPPSPPLSSEASFEGASPTKLPTASTSTSRHPSGYYGETTPPLDGDQHHRHPLPGAPTPRPGNSLPRHPLPPASSLDQPPNGSYFSAPPPQPQQPPAFYQQRPLPQNFPPPPPAPSSATSPGPNPWQHHHYLTPSQGGQYPQNQDRYICQTCNKAFSRPSSLRIHNHSHTGEKPFKCPHAGCGKAFSVRSNMKRHERGCHSFEVNSGEPMSP